MIPPTNLPRKGGGVTCLLLAALLALPATGGRHVAHGLRPLHVLAPSHAALPFPPSTAFCHAFLQIDCYQPFQLQRAYGVDRLHSRGLTGAGRTIAIVEPFGSPTIDRDLHRYDAAFGVPDPPWLRVISPSGAPPAFDPWDDDMAGWAMETTLDVEAAHLMAPGAGLLVVTTPVNEGEGLQGFPEIMSAEGFVVDHGLADVISQSFGATEETFPSPAALLGLRGPYERARDRGVTLLAASGDTGSTSPYLDGSCCYPRQVNSWPASDPLVTAVGGTRLHLDDAGRRTAPDEVWNDTLGASGGGPSHVFGRDTPDISMSAAGNGALVVYWSFLSRLAAPGFHLVSGTSESAPLFAGVVAIADQIRRGPVGWLNGRLALLGQQGAAAGIVDVTRGDNSYPFEDAGGRQVTVPGFAATPGYDLASGWGTVDASRLCFALAS